jgi:hypothetical protein
MVTPSPHSSPNLLDPNLPPCPKSRSKNCGLLDSCGSFRASSGASPATHPAWLLPGVLLSRGRRPLASLCQPRLGVPASDTRLWKDVARGSGVRWVGAPHQVGLWAPVAPPLRRCHFLAGVAAGLSVPALF